jgi:hypothetical protein
MPPTPRCLGGAEDPVAYIMRHTQLLPRHLIEILNEIVAPAVDDLGTNDTPRVSAEHVLKGVRKAEHRIVEGILTTYSHPYPEVAAALAAIKNHAEIAIAARQLHERFNRASAQRSGMDFDQFLDACLAIGALGVVTGGQEGDARYVQGEFSYTYAEDIRPVEDRDVLCVHPLFMYRFFDNRSVRAMAGRGVKPVYPYGSDPAHDEYDL